MRLLPALQVSERSCLIVACPLDPGYQQGGFFSGWSTVKAVELVSFWSWFYVLVEVHFWCPTQAPTPQCQSLLAANDSQLPPLPGTALSWWEASLLPTVSDQGEGMTKVGPLPSGAVILLCGLCSGTFCLWVRPRLGTLEPTCSPVSSPFLTCSTLCLTSFSWKCVLHTAFVRISVLDSASRQSSLEY